MYFSTFLCLSVCLFVILSSSCQVGIQKRHVPFVRTFYFVHRRSVHIALRSSQKSSALRRSSSGLMRSERIGCLGGRRTTTLLPSRMKPLSWYVHFLLYVNARTHQADTKELTQTDPRLFANILGQDKVECCFYIHLFLNDVCILLTNIHFDINFKYRYYCKGII